VSRQRRPLVLLGLGAAVGLALATAGVLGSSRGAGALPDGAVARVNGVPIRSDAYKGLIAGLASDLRRPVDEADQRRVLDRLIEEELLVQRGLELGLARYDRRVRGDLVSAVIAAVTSDAEDRAPSPDEVRDFYEAERDFFTRPGRLRVRQVFLRVPSPEAEPGVRARAERARDRLRAGEPIERVREELGDREIVSVPDAALPAAKLREYLGPTALRASLELAAGDISEPVRSGTGIHVIQLVARELDRVPPLEEIATQVENEWRRRTGERALREYLDALRESAHVEVTSSDAPKSAP
jgi:hypothetical protein